MSVLYKHWADCHNEVQQSMLTVYVEQFFHIKRNTTIGKKSMRGSN